MRGGWIALAVLLFACEELPTGPPVGDLTPLRGVSLVEWSAEGYAQPASVAALDDLAALGATHVVLVPTGYQSSSSSDDPAADPVRTPSRSSVRTVIRAATSRGLSVVLKPHLDLDDGRWRGGITPRAVDAWFTAYRTFLLPWVDLAEEEGVDAVVVGTELARTIEYEDAWRTTITACRDRYHGSLWYAASWDEAHRVPFWDALDVVGIDFYYPVASRANPGRLEIVARWQDWLMRLHLLHEQTGRPVVLTEIGYRSVDGAGMRPYDSSSPGADDPGEQADLYWAALEATRGHGWLNGIVWWNWRADGGGRPGDGDFPCKDKPASDVLRAAWGAS